MVVYVYKIEPYMNTMHGVMVDNLHYALIKALSKQDLV